MSPAQSLKLSRSDLTTVVQGDSGGKLRLTIPPGLMWENSSGIYCSKNRVALMLQRLIGHN